MLVACTLCECECEALDYCMRGITEAMKAVAEQKGPATIERYYVFNDQDSSRTGHHWFTVCLRIKRRVGENENTSPEEQSPQRSPERSPEKRSPRKRALMERSPGRSPKRPRHPRRGYGHLNETRLR